ncbi:MAG: rhodanese-like domain-containing protein [Candidatus Kapabacteria bacterium]|nr:rhodanese-like domain-containing protein [Candidatus Kapabacteria bacterium]
MKRLVYEILGIFLISFALGLIYNQFSAKPIPLIRKPPKVEFVDDSLLVGIMKQAQEGQKKDTSNQTDLNIKNSENIKLKDTLVKKESVEIASINKNELLENLKLTEDGFKFINYNQIKKYLNDPSFLIIDARNEIDYANGHIGNAINIDAYMMDQTEYFKMITMLPRDKILIIYCSGGNCDASEKLAKDILSFGFKNVLVYYGGWEEWKSKMK